MSEDPFIPPSQGEIKEGLPELKATQRMTAERKAELARAMASERKTARGTRQRRKVSILSIISNLLSERNSGYKYPPHLKGKISKDPRTLEALHVILSLVKSLGTQTIFAKADELGNAVTRLSQTNPGLRDALGEFYYYAERISNEYLRRDFKMTSLARESIDRYVSESKVSDRPIEIKEKASIRSDLPETITEELVEPPPDEKRVFMPSRRQDNIRVSSDEKKAIRAPETAPIPEPTAPRISEPTPSATPIQTYVTDVEGTTTDYSLEISDPEDISNILIWAPTNIRDEMKAIRALSEYRSNIFRDVSGIEQNIQDMDNEFRRANVGRQTEIARIRAQQRQILKKRKAILKIITKMLDFTSRMNNRQRRELIEYISRYDSDFKSGLDELRGGNQISLEKKRVDQQVVDDVARILEYIEPVPAELIEEIDRRRLKPPGGDPDDPDDPVDILGAIEQKIPDEDAKNMFRKIAEAINDKIGPIGLSAIGVGGFGTLLYRVLSYLYPYLDTTQQKQIAYIRDAAGGVKNLGISPDEAHPFGDSFLGPNTRLDERLRKQVGDKGHIVTSLRDLIALEHDIRFMSNNAYARSQANKIMIDQLSSFRGKSKGFGNITLESFISAVGINLLESMTDEKLTEKDKPISRQETRNKVDDLMRAYIQFLEASKIKLYADRADIPDLSPEEQQKADEAYNKFLIEYEDYKTMVDEDNGDLPPSLSINKSMADKIKESSDKPTSGLIQQSIGQGVDIADALDTDKPNKPKLITDIINSMTPDGTTPIIQNTQAIASQTTTQDTSTSDSKALVNITADQANIQQSGDTQQQQQTQQQDVGQVMIGLLTQILEALKPKEGVTQEIKQETDIKSGATAISYQQTSEPSLRPEFHIMGTDFVDMTEYEERAEAAEWNKLERIKIDYSNPLVRGNLYNVDQNTWDADIFDDSGYGIQPSIIENANEEEMIPPEDLPFTKIKASSFKNMIPGKRVINIGIPRPKPININELPEPKPKPDKKEEDTSEIVSFDTDIDVNSLEMRIKEILELTQYNLTHNIIGESWEY